jgi:glycosyltransferase involved in cell wall biosynthesis
MGVKRRISVVYCGVPLIKKNENAKRDKELVLYVGRIKRYKSIDHLILAINRLRKNEIPVKLSIVGDGDALPGLKKMAEDLKLSIDFRGFVSEEEKYRIYRSARILVQPSIKEGWGLTSIESQACGTPVICADSPGLRETIIDGKTGYLYPYGNIDLLVRRISELLTNDVKWQEFSKTAEEWAKNFSWDKSAEKMEEILLEEIRGKKVNYA